MDDNQIRIPATDYLSAYKGNFSHLYKCFKNPASCPDVADQKIPQSFEDTYEEVSRDILSRLTPPIAKNKPAYPVLPTDSSLTNTGRGLCLDTANAFFEEILLSAKNEGPDGLEEALFRLHDAVYFARRGGMDEASIQLKLDEIEEAYLRWFENFSIVQKEEEKEEEEVKIPPIPDQELPQKASVTEAQKTPEQPKRKISLSVAPTISYESTGKRTYTGLGAEAEILIPIQPQKPWVVGGTVDALFKLGFEGSNPFHGKLKTIEGSSFPLFFEFGHQSPDTTYLLQAGGWFAYSYVFGTKEEDDPYSDHIFENGTLRLGGKAYFIKNRVALAAGLQKDPWGWGGYGNLGYRFIF